MKRLVLVGGGHAHLFVLDALARAQPTDIEILLVTPAVFQGYSGMLPGWMAGHYTQSQCQIDLRPLAQLAHADLVLDRMIGMDADQRSIHLSGGRVIEYDLLSIDTGSETDLSRLEATGKKLIPIKPLETFFQVWPQILAEAQQAPAYRLAVVGGGAAAVELALAASHALTRASTNTHIDLVASQAGPLSSHAESVQRRITRVLSATGIAVHALHGVGAREGIALSDGTMLRADRVIAATGARAPRWLSGCKLALGEQAYIAVDQHNRSPSHPEVFAVGDICERVDITLAHSGVHAVRAGPVLAANILAALNGGIMQSYRPRPRSLYLLACGPRYAVASWGSWSAEGKWVWRLKDWIDRRFIRQFSDLSSEPAT
ncbi:FAD-dependent oxidoreductase [Alcaligenaceae bacterium CGII-47]|nr:FAD-dependent oxidoreductase [Alcaligenaceae bacterium CGII-47]